MNETKKFIVGMLLYSIVFLSFPITGCATRPVAVATDEPVIAGQVSTERLAGINGTVNEVLSIYDRFIAESQQRAIDRNIDAEEALDRYDEFVQYCIRSLREIERATRSGEGERQDQEYNFDLGRNPFLD